MSNETVFFTKYARRIKEDIHVSAPARVIRVYNNFTADVKPLFMVEEDGEMFEQAALLGVPILRHVGELLPGDVVHINFTDRAIDNLVGNKPFNPEYSRVHSVNDAVIVGVYQL